MPNKKYRDRYKEKNAAYMRNKRANMTEEEKRKEKEYKTKNWHDRKARMTEKDLEERRFKKHEYYMKNREKIIGQVNERIKNNPKAKVVHYARCGIRRVLKSIKKSSKTMELIGCSANELKKHLECQFDNKMNWENYGSYWHVDHIKPCASFDLNNPEEQKKCFHYSNLRPLEAKENLRKGARY